MTGNGKEEKERRRKGEKKRILSTRWLREENRIRHGPKTGESTTEEETEEEEEV
jgi:hypothetical protein